MLANTATLIESLQSESQFCSGWLISHRKRNDIQFRTQWSESGITRLFNRIISQPHTFSA